MPTLPGSTRPVATPSRRRGSRCCTSGSRSSNADRRPRRTCSAATPKRSSRGSAPRPVGSTRTRSVRLRPSTVPFLAAGAAIEAVRLGGFALARPPGHHAEPERAMGFCIFDSIAIAARWAQAELGVGRVAVLDWDVHHGNGTQAIVGDDPSILFASLHQWPFYPGSGGPAEQGETLLNLPLPAGTGDEGYLEAFGEGRVRDRGIRTRAPSRLGGVRRPL